jgi:hypothetical protein
VDLAQKIRDLSILAGCYLLLEAALWSPPGRQLIYGFAALLAMVFFTFARQMPLEKIGVDHRAWIRGGWVILGAIAAAALLLAIAASAGTLQPLASSHSAWARSLLYAIWGLEQEFMLQCFLFLGLMRVFGSRAAVPIAASLFAISHLPNPLLTVATLFVGLALTAAFARYRNLYVVSIAHVILGLAFATSVPEVLHHHMRVGWGYSRYVPRDVSASRKLAKQNNAANRERTYVPAATPR